MIKTFRHEVKTSGYCDIHDLTPAMARYLQETGLQEGSVLTFVSGSTAGITTVEHEPGLIQDLKEFYERLIPQDADYHHEQTWHDGNGFSHVRASLLKPSVTVPFSEGSLLLGTWQQVILIDFDNCSRDRSIVIQISGEK